jgi:hypothetical protein
MRNSVLVVSVLLITACAMQPDLAVNTIDGAENDAIKGQIGDVDFLLTDDPFNVYRPSVGYLLLISLYFPLLLL